MPTEQPTKTVTRISTKTPTLPPTGKSTTIKIVFRMDPTLFSNSTKENAFKKDFKTKFLESNKDMSASQITVQLSYSTPGIATLVEDGHPPVRRSLTVSEITILVTVANPTALQQSSLAKEQTMFFQSILKQALVLLGLTPEQIAVIAQTVIVSDEPTSTIHSTLHPSSRPTAAQEKTVPPPKGGPLTVTSVTVTTTNTGIASAKLSSTVAIFISTSVFMWVLLAR